MRVALERLVAGGIARHIVMTQSGKKANEARVIADYLYEHNVFAFPCKPGDTLWIIDASINSRLKIIDRTVKPSQVYSIGIDKEEGMQIETENAIYFPEHFGEWIFFTKEEAEQRLKEMKDERNTF